MRTVFFGSGTTPMRSDPRWNLHCKILIAIQAGLGGGNPKNDPHRTDPIRRLIFKKDNALAGT